MSLLRFCERGRVEAGCDEAGRGCLAGPVVAAAVILPEQTKLHELDDSKKLSEKARERLVPKIKKEALAWGIAEIGPEEIDRINILNASILAMHKALDGLTHRPDLLLIDGNRFKAYKQIEHRCMIKGDGRFRSIAAASILAKEHRDQLMRTLHETHPQYHWHKNKGYPTAAHRKAILRTGPCELHRQSFRLLPEQLNLPLEGPS